MSDLDGDVQFTLASGAVVRAPLQRLKGALAYNESLVVGDQDGDPEIPVEASWPACSPAGMGESRRISRDSMGSHLSFGVDTTTLGVWRVQENSISSSSPSNALTDVPTFQFEAQDASGNTYVYHQNGRYVYKTSSNGAAITIHEEKDLGANAVAGRAAYFGNASYGPYWFVPAGSAVNFWRLTAVATPPSTDTWAQDGSLKSLAFARTRQGSVVAITRAYSINCLDVSTDGTTFPNVTGATAFQVGDAGSPITDLQDTGPSLFVGKQDNLYEVTSGEYRQLTRFQPFDKSNDYGRGMMAPAGSNACFYPHKGLEFWNGDASENVSLHVNVAMDFLATTANFNVPTYLECAFASNSYFYQVVRWTSSTSGAIWCGFRQNGRVQWHNAQYVFNSGTAIGGAVRGIIIDSSKRAWTLDITSNKFVHFSVGVAGQPNASSTSRGVNGGYYYIYLPSDDFGYPGTLKQFRSMEARVQNASGTQTVQFWYGADEPNSTTQLGADITSDGLAKRFFTSAVSGYALQPLLAWVMSGTPSADTRIYPLTVRAAVRPLGARRFTLTINTALEYGNGGKTEYDAPTLLSNLQTQVRGAPITFVTPNGVSYTTYVEQVSAEATTIEKGGPVHYLIEVQMRDWVLA